MTKMTDRIEVIHPGDPLGNAFWRDDKGANQRIPVPVAEHVIALETGNERLTKLLGQCLAGAIKTTEAIAELKTVLEEDK